MLRKNVITKMNKLGVPFSQKPLPDYGQMPHDPTLLHTKKLQKFLTSMVAFQSYAGEKLALARISLLEASKNLRYEKALLSGGEPNGAKWRVEDKLIKNPRIRKMEKRVMKLESETIILETLTINYESKAKVLSRELSRRLGEYEKGGRIA